MINHETLDQSRQSLFEPDVQKNVYAYKDKKGRCKLRESSHALFKSIITFDSSR